MNCSAKMKGKSTMGKDEYFSATEQIAEILMKRKSRMEVDEIIADLERMEENETYR